MNEDINMANFERRIREIAIPKRAFTNVVRGNCILKNDLPDDVEVTGAYFDMCSNSMILIVASPHFDITPEGMRAPREESEHLFYTEPVNHEED